MLKSGILNPGLNSLLSRVRHTNTLVIADRGFPFWPGVETIDLSVVDDLPRVSDVLLAVRSCWVFGKAFMAEEYREHNDGHVVQARQELVYPVSIFWEPHPAFKLRVPGAIGLIRTGDSSPYSNIILESA